MELSNKIMKYNLCQTNRYLIKKGDLYSPLSR